MDFAFKYVKDNGGIDTEASYNYTAKTGKTCLYNATNSGANLTSWVDIPHNSEAVRNHYTIPKRDSMPFSGPSKSSWNSRSNLCSY